MKILQSLETRNLGSWLRLPRMADRPDWTRGEMVVELGVACLILVALSLIGSFAVVVALACDLNDRACRDAARAAAGASDYATSLKMAQLAIGAHQVKTAFFGPIALESGKFIFEDYGGNPPPNSGPYVEVTTIMPVVVPSPYMVLATPIGHSPSITFRRTYSFPIVKTKLYLPEQ